MNGMQERGDALENKFFHDEDLRFKATARRNRLMGLWAAAKLGKAGDDAEAYAKEVIVADLKEAGDRDVVCKIMDDFKSANIMMEEAEVREKMAHFLQEALDQIQRS